MRALVDRHAQGEWPFRALGEVVLAGFRENREALGAHDGRQQLIAHSFPLCASPGEAEEEVGEVGAVVELCEHVVLPVLVLAPLTHDDRVVCGHESLREGEDAAFA